MSVPVTQLTNLVTGPASVVVLTSAQLLGLKDTPVTLIPARGPNTVIMVSNGYVKYNYKGTVYTVPVGTTLQLRINGINLLGTAIPGTGVLDQTQNTVSMGLTLTNPLTNSLSTLTNKALTIYNTNATNLSVGNGTLEIGLFYNVLTLPA